MGLHGQVVCLHSSLRSFGHVEGGATTLIQSFLDEGCTLLVPTFSSAFEIAPPQHLQFRRNGWDYNAAIQQNNAPAKIYNPAVLDIDRSMGVVPATTLSWPGAVRGNHPLDSFTAIGAHAGKLVANQSPSDVYAPLEVLSKMNGFVVLIGVGLERMTLLHLAEKQAGRTLFRRWANNAHGDAIAVEVGSCSEGFGKLEPHLPRLMRVTCVGTSRWIVIRADQALACASAAIRDNPELTHCTVETCNRCEDAVKGGPILPSQG